MDNTCYPTLPIYSEYIYIGGLFCVYEIADIFIYLLWLQEKNKMINKIVGVYKIVNDKK